MELTGRPEAAVKAAIVQLATKLNLRMSVLKAEDVEINRPEAKGIMASQIIRKMREAIGKEKGSRIRSLREDCQVYRKVVGKKLLYFIEFIKFGGE